MKRIAAIVALVAVAISAAPAAAYEAVVVNGTTNYLELVSTTTKGNMTTEYRLDVGVFDEVADPEAGRYYVCLRVVQSRDGRYLGSNSGCAYEVTQTRLSLDSSLAASLVTTTISLDRASGRCCLAGRTVSVSAAADPTGSPLEFSGCFPSEAGGLQYSSRHAPMAGTLVVKGAELPASGVASQFAFTPPCAPAP